MTLRTMAIKDKIGIGSIVFALVVASIMLFGAPKIKAQSKQRFEIVSYQDTVGIGNVAKEFEVWHDGETGQEIVCVAGPGGNSTPLSCYLTGRTWGKK